MRSSDLGGPWPELGDQVTALLKEKGPLNGAVGPVCSLQLLPNQWQSCPNNKPGFLEQAGGECQKDSPGHRNGVG